MGASESDVLTIKNVAILGAGGNVGTAIIKELLKDDTRFIITAITRQSSTYAPPDGSNIQHKTVDYGSLDSLRAALQGQDAVVNCITGGATQYEPSKLIIDAAIGAGVKFFFANEFVGYIEREQFRRLPESHAGSKVRIREYLEGLGGKGDLVWTSLNGGPFFEMWLMRGPGGFDVKNRRARIYGTGENPLCWTPLPTIALAVANMLRNPNSVANRPVYITPFSHLTQNIILSTLEGILDAKFTVDKIDVEKINTNARIALSRGEMAKAMKGLAISNQFYEGDSGNDFRHVVNNELVGVPNMSVEDAVRDAIERYGPDCAVVEGMFNVEPCEV